MMDAVFAHVPWRPFQRPPARINGPSGRHSPGILQDTGTAIAHCHRAAVSLPAVLRWSRPPSARKVTGTIAGLPGLAVGGAQVAFFAVLWLQDCVATVGSKAAV